MIYIVTDKAQILSHIAIILSTTFNLQVSIQRTVCYREDCISNWIDIIDLYYINSGALSLICNVDTCKICQNVYKNIIVSKYIIP